MYKILWILMLLGCWKQLHCEESLLDLCGRVDIAPIYMRVQVIESSKTVNTLDMGGGRIEATLLPFKGYGFCLKPLLFAAQGDGTFYSTGCGVGHYTPLNDNWALIPVVGVSYTHLHTHIDLPLPFIVLHNVKETFRSRSFYMGMDSCFRIASCWQLTCVFQYVWAHTLTTIGSFPSAKGRTQGTNWGVVVDYFWKENWTVTVAGGYNNSLSKEKHGIRGYGCKIGVAWIF